MIAREIAVPGDSLLHRYAANPEDFTDCFEVMHPLAVDFETYVAAFYTTWLFRMERFGLSIALRRRIRDADAVALAGGRVDRFAVWEVEDRTEGQLLLRDTSGHTRSYLALVAKEGGVTRLIFGSAVVAGPDGTLPVLARALMPFHRLYSKLLLRTAERKLRRG